MLQDLQILRAITAIRQRSERQPDPERLVQSYVDAGIRPLLVNHNNQIVYGRRGTGKTHLLKVLEPDFSKDERTISVYIDARMLGSTSQFSDPALPLKQRCLALFQDVFSEINEALLKYIIDATPENSDAALSLLDRLMTVITAPVETIAPTTFESTVKENAAGGGKFAVKASPAAPSIDISAESSRQRSEEARTTYNVTAEQKIIFPDLQSALRQLLRTVDAHLIILLDEWSSIPLDLQPYLAEFLKRSIIPNALITLKIASLEHRSQFSLREANGTIVGFEVGADISTGLDIDDYYVYDRNPKQIREIFADILYRHLAPDIGDYLATNYNVRSAEQFVQAMFVSEDVFQELARAAEGVVRDLINIFTSAAVYASRRQRETIDRRAVLDAARQWYEQDKVKELSDDLRKVLEDIISDVIGRRKARAFLIPRELEKHPIVQRLFDARVLHLMHRGYADKDNPGRRYNIYSIDYGTYVDLLNTSKSPDVELVEGEPGSEFIVPFDDRRSIRRIVLPELILAEAEKREELLGDELPKESYGGLIPGARYQHPTLGAVTVLDSTAQVITIITEARDIKILATSIALPKLKLLAEENDRAGLG